MTHAKDKSSQVAYLKKRGYDESSLKRMSAMKVYELYRSAEMADAEYIIGSKK